VIAQWQPPLWPGTNATIGEVLYLIWKALPGMLYMLAAEYGLYILLTLCTGALVLLMYLYARPLE
jgi:hypothetical protein